MRTFRLVGFAAVLSLLLGGLIVPAHADAAGTLVFGDSFARPDNWNESHATGYGDVTEWTFDAARYASAPYCAGHVGYAANEMSELSTVNWLDLTGATSATLRFKVWYELESNAQLTVVFETDQLDPVGGYMDSQVATFTGSSGGAFGERVVDVSSLVGHKVRLSFLLSSGPTVSPWFVANGGVRVDDVGLWRNGLGEPLKVPLPKVTLTKTNAPRTMHKGRALTISGLLSPRHRVGTYPVRIYKYRYARGKWKSYGYVKAKASNYSTYTKYSKSFYLPAKGKWRLRAVAPADSKHAKTYSSYDYVTVK